MKHIKSFFISFLFLTFGIAAGFSQTATYTVTKTTDPDPYAHPYNFTDSLCDPDMYGTLAWAINKANDDSVPSNIVFNISGSGTQTIYLNYALPTIKSDSITIDGTTQPGYTYPNPAIIIDGQNNIVTALSVVSVQYAGISGIDFRNFTTQGIVISHSNNITVSNCLITGIYNGPSNNDATTGIMIVTSENCSIQGNYIGTNAAGDSLGIEDYGVMLWLDANNNLIGGAGYGNVMAYCGIRGVYVVSSVNDKISRNLIHDNPVAIFLANGANNNKAAPDSLQYNDSTQVLSGIAEPYDTIEVFGGTGPENANEYLGSTQADGNGNWDIQVQTTDSFLVVTATDGNNNTSDFKSFKEAVCNWYLSSHNICLGESVLIYGYQDLNSPPFSGGPCSVTQCFTFHDQINSGPQVYNNGIIDGVYTTPFTITPTVVGTYYIQSHGSNCDNYNNGDWIGSDGHYNTGQAEILVVYDIPHIFTYGGPISACEGETLTLTPSNDQSYSYSWNTGETTSSIDVTTSGTYFVTVTNSDNCSVIGTYDVQFHPNPDITLNGTTPVCNGNPTTLSVVVNSGGPITDYSWSTGVSGATMSSITDYPTSTITYTVTVTNDAGCTAEESFTVTVNPNPTPTITGGTFFCYGGSTTLDAGSGYNTYQWNTGVTSQAITATDGGTYSVTVTDANGCSGETQVTVTENPEIIITPIVTNAACSGDCDGSINLLVAGGTSPYSYLWSNGQTTPAINNLCEGTYSVTVTDANGCTAETNATVTAHSNPTVSISADPSGTYYCSNETDPVTLTANASGGLSFTYLWSTGATSQSISVLPSLQGTNYSVTVTNNFGCSSTATFNFQIADPPVVNFGLQNPLICAGGSVTLSPSVTPYPVPYTYSWSTGTSEPTLTVSQGGTYTVTVTDANGCSASASITVEENPAITLTLNTTDISCPCSQYGTGQADGAIDLTVTGGTPPYDYSWSGPNGFTATTEDLSGLCEGTYTVVVTDDAGCTATTSATVNTYNPGWTTLTTIFPGTTVNWNSGGTYYVDHAITVQSDGFFIISNNSTVKFTPTGKIIVEQNAQLQIDHAVLTSYDNCQPEIMWQGIEVLGNTFGPQNLSSQGYVMVINNSKIENAVKAINLHGGAMLRADHSTFSDNYYDITIGPYYGTPPNAIGIAYCNFLTSANMAQIGPHYYPNTHILAYHSTLMVLNYNTFENSVYASQNLIPDINSGYGIREKDCSIKVLNSNFNSLFYGVDAISSMLVHTYLEECTFTKNYRGTYFFGTDNRVQQKSCTFDISDPVTPVLNTNVSWGSYVYGCQKHNIQNNTFNNGPVGQVIRKTFIHPDYALNNIIYRNTFDNINAIPNQSPSFAAFGHNDGDLLLCNTFTASSEFDIYLHKGTIKRDQVNFTYGTDPSTKNLFFNGCIAGVSKIDIENANATPGSVIWDFDIGYAYSNTGDNTDPSACTSNGPNNFVFLSPPPYGPSYQQWIYNDPLEYDNGCPVTLPSPTSTPLLSMADYGDAISHYNTVIAQKQDSLMQLVDGGDTPGLLNEVQTLTPRNYFRVAADLYDAAPYLSDTVLLEFMRNPIHRPLAKTVVLWHDSPLPERGKQELNQTNLPPVFKYLLWQYQNGINPREQKEADIRKVQDKRSLTLTDMAFYAAGRDTLPAVRDSIIDILTAQPGYQAKYQLIPLLIAYGNYPEAANQMNELDNMTSGLPPAERQQVVDFIDYQQISMQLAQTPGTAARDSIIQANSNFLTALAQDDESLYGPNAKLLLSTIGLDTIIADVPLPDPMGNKQLEIEQPVTQPDFSGMDWSQLLDIYPNPAGDELSVEYALIEKGQYRLAVFNLKGKLLLSKPVTEPFGLIKLQTDDLPGGNYIISVTNTNQPSKISKQFTVVH